MKSFINFIVIFLSVLNCFSQQTKAAKLADLQVSMLFRTA